MLLKYIFGVQIADVFRGGNFKAFYISCALVFFQQFCGINAVLFYMTVIFSAAGSDMDPDIAVIIIGAVQVIFCSIDEWISTFRKKSDLFKYKY